MSIGLGGGPTAEELSAWMAALAQAQMDAAARVEAAKVSAQIQADAQRDAMAMRTQADVTIAQIETGNRVQVAQVQGTFGLQVAQTEAQSRGQVAALETASAQGIAQTTTQGRITEANIGANATMTSAQIDASWHQGVANTELTGVEYRSDKEYAGVQLHEQSETQRLNIKLAYADSKFNTLLPLINQALGIAGGITGQSAGQRALGFPATSQAGASPTARAAGSDSGANADPRLEVGHYERRRPGPLRMMADGDIKTQGIGFATSSPTLPSEVAGTELPFIATGGVLTPNQIQQQVNSSWATAAAKTISSVQQLTQDLTGRGFSAQSPLLSALSTSIVEQGVRSAMTAEQQLRLGAAQQNANALLAQQSALSEQFLKQEGVLVDEQRNEVTRTVGVIQAVMGMIGSAI